MADKMMRIAGRGKDGSAKALQTDNEGSALIALKSSEVTTLHDNQTSISNGNTFDVSGYGTVAIQVIGSFDGRLQFVGAVYGTGFSPIPARNILSNHTVTSTDKSGIYFLNVSGFEKIQVRILEINSGSVRVYAKAVSYQYAPPASRYVGSINKTRSGAIIPGTETLFSHGINNNLTIESLEFSGNDPTSLYLKLRARNKNGEFSDAASQSIIVAKDGSGIMDVNFKNVFDNKSSYWEIVHYDDSKNEYKLILTKSLHIPNGATLEIINTSNQTLNAAVHCVLTEHN